MLFILDRLLMFFLLAIFVRAILSWFPIGRDNPIVTIVFQITEPILGPIRRMMPRTMSIDLSPMIAMFLIFLLRAMLLRAA